MLILKTVFRSGMKITQVPIAWFRAVSGFLSNIAAGTGIKIRIPATPDGNNPVHISIDESYLDGRLRGLVTEDMLNDRLRDYGHDDGAGGGGASYTAGDGIDAAALAQGQIAVDPDQVVTVLAAEDPDVTIDGNTASGTDETLDQTTWEAGGTSKLVKAEFTRAKAVTVNNVYYYRLFWRIKTINPNGTVASYSAEQGYVQVRRL